MNDKKQVFYKTEEEIELIRQSSLLVGKTLAELARHIAPGVTTLQLDAIAHQFIKDHHAEPAFLGYGGFPNSICTSPNDVVVHGIPDHRPLEEGDVLSVDCGVLMNGFYGDSAYTFKVGHVSQDVDNLLRVTRECLYLGIEKAIAGNRVGDIGWAVQQHAEAHGYGVVRELVGHGLGRQLHEAPEVPNYGSRGSGMQLKPGLVIAIEPMINMGMRKVRQHDDGWTVSTQDKMPSAHFEHTIVVRRGRAEVLSSFDGIEAALGVAHDK